MGSVPRVELVARHGAPAGYPVETERRRRGGDGMAQREAGDGRSKPAALVWLMLGVLLGALLLVDRQAPGSWRRWFSPTHGHILVVGWFLQFAVGIAYWLLPRQRSEPAPLGYNERVAHVALVTLNIALALRVVAEPAARAGYQGGVTDAGLLVSALGHVVAVGIIVVQLWGRVIPRASRRQGR
jgi:hypothetical protein